MLLFVWRCAVLADVEVIFDGGPGDDGGDCHGEDEGCKNHGVAFLGWVKSGGVQASSAPARVGVPMAYRGCCLDGCRRRPLNTPGALPGPRSPAGLPSALSLSSGITHQR